MGALPSYLADLVPEGRRGVPADLFLLVPLPDDLSVYAERAFRYIEACANLGLYCRADDLSDAIGTENSSGSTQRGECVALEKRGLITTECFHQGRQFTIVATGKKTLPPRSLYPNVHQRRAIQKQANEGQG